MIEPNIRIGTVVDMKKGAPYIAQLLPHGFESFNLTFWQYIGDIDIEETAKRVLDVIGDQAVISTIGLFGNPLQDEQSAKDFERCIKAAHLFETDMVAGFAGAIEGEPIPNSMPQFIKVWGHLAQVARDNGVRIAWENCDMAVGGTLPVTIRALANGVGNDVRRDSSENLGLQWEPCHQMVHSSTRFRSCASSQPAAKSSTFMAKMPRSRGTCCVKVVCAAASNMSGIALPASVTPTGRT
jgi:sugar phosphate isomerase/epimerase